LRRPCSGIEFPLSPSLLEHLGDLQETLAALPDGLALASNQVRAEGFRAFVVKPGLGLPELVIDPQWSPTGREVEVRESCLSVPGLSLVTRRAERVELWWYDRDGTRSSMDCRGMQAQVVQHECDHLDGKLIVDYLSKNERVKLRMRVIRERKRG
jgi:peptide deformylase